MSHHPTHHEEHQYANNHSAAMFTSQNEQVFLQDDLNASSPLHANHPFHENTNVLSSEVFNERNNEIDTVQKNNDDVNGIIILQDSGLSDSPEPASSGLHSQRTERTSLKRLPLTWTDKVVNAFHTVIPPGGHLSNIFNLASGTLGIGIVSMPSGFHTTGLILAAILIVICAILVIYSFYLIGVACERTPEHSWESVSRHLLFRGADYLVAAILIFFLVGTTTGYVIAIHDLLVPFLNSDSANPFLRSDNGHRILTAVIWLFGMVPLCIPRRVSSLRYFSIVGVALIILFMIAIIYNSCAHHLPHLHELRMFSSGLDAVNGLTLFIFAFLGHSLAFRMFDEMPKPSARNLGIAGGGCVTLVGILYYLVGFFGYADIGNVVSGSIFKYYNVRENTFMLVVYIGVMLKICVAYALCTQGCRLPVYYILRRQLDTSPLWLHLLISLSLCLISFILGVFIPDINIVFNLLGSICGGTLAFLFPAYYVLYSGGWTVKKVGWFHVGLTYINLMVGVVAIVFGTVMAIYGVVEKYS